MTKYVTGLLALICMSCGRPASDDPPPLIVQPGELKFKSGDCLAFRSDSLTYGAGIVFDFSKDEGGIWYGLLLTDYESTDIPTTDALLHSRFLGRKIESSQSERGFGIVLDAEYVLDSLLNHFTLVGNLKLNSNTRLGAQGATSGMAGLIEKLKYGKERRLRPPDDYGDHRTRLNTFRPDEYFDVKDFVEK